MRNPFGWDLPPGVTNADIDRAAGPATDVCPTCDGEGKIFRSACCDEEFYDPGWPDNDMCSGCKEHSEPYKCEDCDGSGEVQVEKPHKRERDDD